MSEKIIANNKILNSLDELEEYLKNHEWQDIYVSGANIDMQKHPRVYILAMHSKINNCDGDWGWKFDRYATKLKIFIARVINFFQRGS